MKLFRWIFGTWVLISSLGAVTPLRAQQPVRLALWLNENYQNRGFVNQLVDAIQQQGADVVFIQISSANLQKLSIKTDDFTQDIQYLLNRLATPGIGIRGCASILSDFFTGTDAQMARFTRVDHLIDFNRNRNIFDAGFTCVGTDLEIARGSRSSSVYDKWKEFHMTVKDRIASQGSDLKLVAWMDGPDFLVQTMDDSEDREFLMNREGITLISSGPTLYSGAIKYFTTSARQDNVALAIADAVTLMWYFPTPGPIQRRLAHNITELESLPGDNGVNKPFLIAAVKVPQLDGVCRNRRGEPVDDCLRTQEDYIRVLNSNDDVRINFSSFIGTAVFKWPFPRAWTP